MTGALPVMIVSTVLFCAGAAAGAGPLANVVLDDASGQAWRPGELDGTPVLLVIADRQAASQADAWGASLAAAGLPLAPWRAAGRIPWLAVADLRRVPEWARDAARARVREREAARGPAERRQCSPLLLDWHGALVERFRPDRARPLVVLLAADGRVLLEERGAVGDAAVTRLRHTIAGLHGD